MCQSAVRLGGLRRWLGAVKFRWEDWNLGRLGGFQTARLGLFVRLGALRRGRMVIFASGGPLAKITKTAERLANLRRKFSLPPWAGVPVLVGGRIIEKNPKLSREALHAAL